MKFEVNYVINISFLLKYAFYIPFKYKNLSPFNGVQNNKILNKYEMKRIKATKANMFWIQILTNLNPVIKSLILATPNANPFKPFLEFPLFDLKPAVRNVANSLMVTRTPVPSFPIA